MKDLDVLIIGGGIGGMTTALALQQRGCRVSIFEQSVGFAEVGAARECIRLELIALTSGESSRTCDTFLYESLWCLDKNGLAQKSVALPTDWRPSRTFSRATVKVV